MREQERPYIYESPDGGQTVYRRRIGDLTGRKLYSQTQEAMDLIQRQKHSQRWGDIHRAAQTDPVLKEMLDQIEVYWSLKDSS